MRRIAFNVFAILSLLVFVASVCIWVRSYFVGERVKYTRAKTDSTQQPPVPQAETDILDCECGVIILVRVRIDGLMSAGGWKYHRFEPTIYVAPTRAAEDRFSLRFGKFQLRHTVIPGWFSQHDIAVPLWVFLPAALPPLLWLRRRRRTLGRGFPVTAASDRRSDIGDQNSDH